MLIFCLTAWLGGCALGGGGRGGKSVLWRVTTPTNTVYLMGSVHVLPERVYPLKPALNSAFADADRLVFEIPLDDPETQRASRAATEAGMYPAGDSLERHISPVTLQLLAEILPAFDLKLEQIRGMRPWVVSDLLMNRYLEHLGYSGELGLDMYFYEKARRERKPIQGLEKLRDQASIFTRMTDEEADAYLHETLVSLPSTAEWFRVTVKAWSAGDVESIDEVINHTRISGDDRFFDAVFEKRNNAWLPQIRRMIGARDDYLVIVGAGHLVGRFGLVEVLRREGFTVEQL